MYNDILTTMATVLNALGTIVSVWSVVNMSYEDAMKARTAGYQDHRERELLQNKHAARVGLWIILIGTIFQIICIFLKDISTVCFLILVVVMIVMLCIALIIEKIKFGKDMDKAEQANP